MDHLESLKELQKRRISRRNFVAGAGAVGATMAMAGCATEATSGINPNPVVPGPTTPAVVTLTDADYLNFALNLEYLEANFYLFAATGAGLPSTMTGGTGTLGTVTGGAQVMQSTLTTAQIDIINEIAFDEQQHVLFLRSALGSAAVAQPALNIGTAFQALATAAGIPGGATFSPYANFDAFLLGAFVFEDVGVTAYSGAAPLLTSASNLNYAAGIQAVEAYHAAYVRTALTARAIAAAQATPPTPYPYLAYANQVAALRTTLGGSMTVPNETALTIPTLNTTTGAITASAIVNATTANAIAYARTTDQVLHIVYGAGGTSGLGGGTFFPVGMNGNIQITKS